MVWVRTWVVGAVLRWERLAEKWEETPFSTFASCAVAARGSFELASQLQLGPIPVKCVAYLAQISLELVLHKSHGVHLFLGQHTT